MCKIQHLNLLRNNLEVPLQEGGSEHVSHFGGQLWECVYVWGSERVRSTDRERARPDGILYTASSYKARDPAMHAQ